MPKAPAVTKGASDKQRQILKALLRGRRDTVIEHHHSGNTWLAREDAADDEKLLPSTFWALHRSGWIEEVTTWATIGTTYWTISEAGREALR